VVYVQNLYRVRIEPPESYQNQIHSDLVVDPQDETRLAILAEWQDRSVKALLEPTLKDFARTGLERMKLSTPGRVLEDLFHAIGESLGALPDDLHGAFDVGVVLCSGRSLYVLYSEGLAPLVSLGGPPQPLESGLRLRVRELTPQVSPQVATALGGRLRLVRVFFEDEDRALLWMPSHGNPPRDLEEARSDAAAGLAPQEGNVDGARIVVLKDPVHSEDVFPDIDSGWPEVDETPRRDRATMSYVALVLVVVVFGTALFGMSRWQRIPDPVAPTSAALSEKVDSQAEAPARVSPVVVESERTEPLQVASVPPPTDRIETVSMPPADAPKPVSLELAWSKRHGDWVTSSPQLIQDRVVYGCRDGKLYAVDENGAPVWQYNSGSGIGATPEVDGTRVFCGNYGGKAFAVRAFDGQEIWTRALGAKIVASPASGRRHVYFQTYGGEVVALDKKTGKVAWRRTIGGQIRARALIHRDELVVISGTGKVLCLSQESGKPRWQSNAGAGVISNPLRVGTNIVFGSRNGYVNALSLEDGSVVWRSELGGAVNSSPSSNETGTRLFVGCSDRGIYALNAIDGSIVWRYRTRSPVLSKPWVEGEIVYITSYDRNTYALNADDGSLRGSIALGAPIYSSPLVHDGQLYVGSNDGTFYCVTALR
jgi:outer membrane protein assembly factor BamB